MRACSHPSINRFPSSPRQIAIAEQQVAIGKMRRLKAQGLSLRTIAERMNEVGISISHVAVKKALANARNLGGAG